jgi:hypothetical protein
MGKNCDYIHLLDKGGITKSGGKGEFQEIE